MTAVAEELLRGDADRASDAVDEIAHDLLAQLEEVVPDALKGRAESVQRYRRTYDALLHRCTEAIRDADLAWIDPDGRQVFAEVKRHGSGPHEFVLATFVDAPLSRWAAALGPGRGVALVMVEALRDLAGAEPMQQPPSVRVPVEDGRDWDQLYRYLRTAQKQALVDPDPLERIAQVLDLNETELGRLFGVTRQAIDQWRIKGVPRARQAKLATVAAIADLLDRKLKSGRVPGVVRRAAEAYGDRTMLDVIAADEYQWLLANLRDAFDWSTTA